MKFRDIYTPVETSRGNRTVEVVREQFNTTTKRWEAIGLCGLTNGEVNCTWIVCGEWDAHQRGVLGAAIEDTQIAAQTRIEKNGVRRVVNYSF